MDVDTEEGVLPPSVTEQKHSSIPLSLIIATLLLFGIWAGAYVVLNLNKNAAPVPLGNEASHTEKYAGKKILYIDSYHEGYEWSDGLTTGITEGLRGTGVDLRVVRMDTKRNPSEEWKVAAGLKMKAEIEAFQPDVVIAADDNAFKYVIQPFYRNAKIPVVFAGINWDASVYGAPYTNTTGMIEVSLTTQIIDQLKPFTRGTRLGYLSADTETERKNLVYYEKLFGLKFERSYFVKDMNAWKKAYLALQKEVDLIIFENNAGISDWNDEVAERYASEHIAVPVGTTNPWVMKESILGITKVPNEQGEWAAQAALKILDGVSPETIPVAKNEKGALIINLGLAEKLGIVFSPSILKNAQVAK